MIKLHNLAKRYRNDLGYEKWVFQDINLEIAQKSRVGIIGRNGAGKSTLLRLIAGADYPTRGEVKRECNVSWPLGFAGGLPGSMTGAQSVRFVCRINGVPDDEIQAHLDYVKDFSELGDAFRQPINTYSSGMSGRLKFAMSLVFKFDVYLSDELVSVGDAGFNKKSKEAFKTTLADAGLIMVAHSEGMLKEYCESGILLHNGAAHWFDQIDDAFKAYKETLPS
jgi:capsular polysaccharide transport system ATP-binding protein